MEEQFKDGMAAVHKKGKYVESIKKQIFAKVASVQKIEERAEALRATIAERTVVAPRIIVPTAPSDCETGHHSAYFDKMLANTKKVSESMVLSAKSKEKPALIQSHWATIEEVRGVLRIAL